MAELIGDITAAATSQSAGISQVTGAVGELDRMTQENAVLVEQMRGNYRVKNEGLKPLHHEAQRLAARIGTVTFEHVRRELNKEADRLSNLGMDAN